MQFLLHENATTKLEKARSTFVQSWKSLKLVGSFAIIDLCRNAQELAIVVGGYALCQRRELLLSLLVKGGNAYEHSGSRVHCAVPCGTCCNTQTVLYDLYGHKKEVNRHCPRYRFTSNLTEG